MPTTSETLCCRKGMNATCCGGESRLGQKLLETKNEAITYSKPTQQDIVSENVADKVESQEHSKHQNGNTLQDLYTKEYNDDEDDDDSDWEPVNTIVIKRWFCTNCTMPNFEDFSNCHSCGEHKDYAIPNQESPQAQIPITADAVRYPDSCSETGTSVGFDVRMLLHSEVEMKSHPHPERPDRLRAIAASLASAGLFPGKCSLIPAREITEEELQRVHSVDHIEAVQQTSRMLSSYFTSDTYANEHSACSARIAAGLCTDLALSILSGRTRNGFALVRPPGHHAGVKQAMGFCLHNNAAVAALAAQRAGAKKVLIVDWDVHHGNGTQEIFDGNKSTGQDSRFPGRGRTLNSTLHQSAPPADSDLSLQARLLDDPAPNPVRAAEVRDGPRISDARHFTLEADGDTDVGGLSQDLGNFEEELKKLVSMGFEKIQAEIALTAADGDPNVAIEILMTQLA